MLQTFKRKQQPFRRKTKAKFNHSTTFFMKRTVSPDLKTMNILGRAFSEAKASTQLRLKAALLEHSEVDDVNYWRAFRDVWRYSSNIGRAPFILVQTAKEILNVEIENTK